LDEGKREPTLPLRTLHDFLFELNDDWDKFRRGSMWSMVTTVVLFVLFIPRYFLITLKTPNRLDTLIALGIVASATTSTPSTAAGRSASDSCCTSRSGSSRGERPSSPKVNTQDEHDR
jgi:hypothetical protein